MPAIHEIVVDDPALIASAVVNRAGVALIRETLLADALHNGTVVPLFDKAVPTRYGYHLVCPLARSSEPKIATFRSWLCDMANRTVIVPEQHAVSPVTHS